MAAKKQQDRSGQKSVTLGKARPLLEEWAKLRNQDLAPILIAAWLAFSRLDPAEQLIWQALVRKEIDSDFVQTKQWLEDEKERLAASAAKVSIRPPGSSTVGHSRSGPARAV